MTNRKKSPTTIILGMHSYFCGEVEWNLFNKKLIVGNYTSIADKVIINLSNGINHDLNNVSTYPFGGKLYKHLHNKAKNTNGDVNIGSDVWIGERATIMSGVTIGDGAVIANNSHVVKDVNPYSVTGGNPAKHIKYRFDDLVVSKLLKIKWWNWDDKKIEQNAHLLCQPDIHKFIKSHA